MKPNVDAELANQAGGLARRAHDALSAFRSDSEPPIARTDLSSSFADRSELWPRTLPQAVVSALAWMREAPTRISEIEHQRAELQATQLPPVLPLSEWLNEDKKIAQYQAAVQDHENRADEIQDEITATKRPLLFGRAAHDKRILALNSALANEKQGLQGALESAERRREVVRGEHTAAQISADEARAREKSLAVEKDEALAAELDALEVEADRRALGAPGVELDFARALFCRFLAATRWTEDIDSDQIALAVNEGNHSFAQGCFPLVRTLVCDGAFEIFRQPRLIPGFRLLLEDDEHAIGMMATCFLTLGEMTNVNPRIWKEDVRLPNGEKRWISDAIIGPVLEMLTDDDVAKLVHSRPTSATSFANICLAAEQAGHEEAIRLGMIAYLIGAAGAESQGMSDLAEGLNQGYRRFMGIWERLRNPRRDASKSENVWRRVNEAAQSLSFGGVRACHVSVNAKLAEKLRKTGSFF